MEAHFDKVFEAETKKPRESAPREERHARSSKRVKHSVPEDRVMAEKDDEDETDLTLNARVVKQMVASLEKKMQKNDLMRSKYENDPSKFMESEIALHEDMTKMKDVATDPSLFQVLIEHGAIPLFVQLLTHTNMDIRMDVVALLADMTDVERVGDMEFAQALVEAIVALNGLVLLCDNLATLTASDDDDDDDEKRTAVYNTLHIVENLAELEPECCRAMATSTPMLTILLHQCNVKGGEMTENRLYCSEILSIVLQSSDDDTCMALVAAPGTEDRLDLILQVLAKYRKKDPATTEEEEFVENLFNALCSALRVAAVQDRFRSLQGFELMLRCVKENKFCTTSALRVVDHAIMNHARNCERVIEIGGLKQLFPAFMGKLKRKKKQEATQDEHLVSILATLCLWTPVESKHAVLDRFHAKFLEANLEKTDRLVDQFVKYYGRVHALPAPTLRPDDDNDNDFEEAMEGYRLHQLEHGLFPLQQLAFVVCHVLQVFKSLRPHVAQTLHAHALSLASVRDLIANQVASLEKDGDDDTVQTHRLRDLVDAMQDNTDQS
ncbi:Aste57867_21524 [Aphanomyces stellatus]|uniref:Aste57867_21524 protein n=1 Tax=Aphanomyces stellatus TaxID=120398 RepID=A0A485LHQ0_9STRA|nr:hypothetical protein As57867_021455 [Aphanomyces stellatus]VFT98194.1 Aste57867_21524 [Aphanomyces stellatus]